ncbi:MAG: FGGY-family carbohydrate kinase [Treponema sp.]|jgi:sugar (pentulose or hexulose) kinase|nr:FGGY-family carbohydrate kinase [Treponema sp.]
MNGQAIINGKTALGIELGSTRIKAVLIGEDCTTLASGGETWENRLENGLWTYRLDEAWQGLQSAVQKLSAEVQNRYGVPLTTVGAIGISGMMHGYLAFDKDGKQLAPFLTWRNTNTERSAKLLTDKFGFNIPLRWSIAQLYQAILNKEDHLKDISYLTTLAGYVHWKLTGQRVLGIGEASGMFPIDSKINNYNAGMIDQFDSLTGDLKDSWKLRDILPRVLSAGEDAGSLTAQGAVLLDPSGSFKAGIPLCPPEGDAGTGMVATNSVAERTGNISAGTSVFAMVVLEKDLSRVYPEIDMVTTPTGKPVAMVHCNNCTSDLDAWVKLFGEITEAFAAKVDKPRLYDGLYEKALEGDADCGGLLSYNYYAGEPITVLEQGRPLFTRKADSRFTLANFMRSLLFSTMATLKIGMDILTEKEHVRLDKLLGHGGLFKTKVVGQRLMAAALKTPVAVMETAGEGGAWGIALLAAYGQQKNPGELLEVFLAQKVFDKNSGELVEPDAKDMQGFSAFIQRYERGLAIEKAAVEYL